MSYHWAVTFGVGNCMKESVLVAEGMSYISSSASTSRSCGRVLSGSLDKYGEVYVRELSAMLSKAPKEKSLLQLVPFPQHSGF
jgi:hypothetical protein